METLTHIARKMVLIFLNSNFSNIGHMSTSTVSITLHSMARILTPIKHICIVQGKYVLWKARNPPASQMLKSLQHNGQNISWSTGGQAHLNIKRSKQ